MERNEIEVLLAAAEHSRVDEGALETIIDKLEEGVRDHGTSEVRYACAYAWYIHPRRLADEVISMRVDDLLQSVIAELPEDYLSLLYLGHNSYDRGNYIAAKKFFEQARAVAPRSYIGLKAYEMVACCDIATEGLEGALSALKEFVDEASNSRSYKPEDIWPRELATALRRTPAAVSTSGALTQAEQLASRLDELGSLKGWISSLVRDQRTRTN